MRICDCDTKTIVGVCIAGRRVSNRTFLHVLTATIHGSRKRTRDRPTSTTTFPNRLAAPKENRGRPRHAPTNRVLPDTARRRHQHTISHSTEDAKRSGPFPRRGSGHPGAVQCYRCLLGVKWPQVQNPVSPTKELAVQRRFWRNPEPPRRHLRSSIRQPELATPTLTARADPPTGPPRPAPCRRMCGRIRRR